MMSKIHIKVLYAICTLLISMSTVFAQAPYISSIDKTSAAFGETLFISGNNFPSLANTTVFFGAAKATVVSASSSLIEVLVPSNTTTDNITVTDTSTGEIAFSNEVFFLSFGGSTFDKTKLDTPIPSGTTGTDTYDLCACDFDLNGVTDIVTTNEKSNSIQIFTNNSTNTTITFSRTPINLGIGTINTTCGDLNGDGLADLIVSRGAGGNEMFIYTNTSTSGSIEFNPTPLKITSPNDDNGNLRDIRRLVINDLDLNGKPEIITSNTSDNILVIYKNISTTGTISFDSEPIQLTVTGSLATSGLDVKDLNSDGLPDIVLCENGNDNFYIVQNRSEPGSIAFLDSYQIDLTGTLQNIKLGDLDNDGLADIALTERTSGKIILLKNTTSGVGATVAFDNTEEFTGLTLAWGLDFGDLEGDGDLDIIGTSAGSSNELFIIENNGGFNFTKDQISIGRRSQNVKIVDINGDAKPDIVYTELDDDNLSVIINRNCVTPQITPSTEQTICSTTTLRLETVKSNDANYEWQVDKSDGAGFVQVKTGTDNFYDVLGTGGIYRVVFTSDGAGCTSNSNTVNIVVDNAKVIGTVVAGNDISGDSKCEGEAVNLSATTITGATYTWSGPNGYTSNLQNPLLSPTKESDTGLYTVFAEKDGCISNSSSTTVSIDALPLIIVTNDDQDTFCTGRTVDIKISNFGSSYTYQWKKDGSELTGQDNTTLTVSESGDYSAVITNGNSCSYESPARTLTSINLITANFTIDDADNAICKDLPIVFTASSSGQDPVATYPLSYSWDYGDGSTVATGSEPTYTYTTASNPTYTATLTTTYTDVTNCPSATHQETITITDIPEVDISSDGGALEKCPSETIGLSIDSQYTNPVWSTSEEDSNINVLDPGTYTVAATDQFGCSFTSNPITISNFSSSGINITSTTNDIDVNKLITLSEDQEFVELTVNNATANIVWTPANLIADINAETVRVFLNDINIVAQVTANDPEGCIETDMVTINNPNVRYKKAFSPNGDGIGDDCWEISNSRGDSFSSCKIYIFDSKGSLIKEASGPFADDCVWDGNLSGSQVPEGVYYYALKCDDNGLSKSGSILLAR